VVLQHTPHSGRPESTLCGWVFAPSQCTLQGLILHHAGFWTTITVVLMGFCPGTVRSTRPGTTPHAGFWTSRITVGSLDFCPVRKNSKALTHLPFLLTLVTQQRAPKHVQRARGPHAFRDVTHQATASCVIESPFLSARALYLITASSTAFVE
jgi:hypothetical protein